MADELDDNASYLVELKKPIQLGAGWMRPGNRHVLKGAIVKELQAVPANEGYVNVIKAV